MTKLNFNNATIKGMLDSLKILSGKDAKCYIMAGDKAVEDKLPVTFVNTEDRSQHIFCKAADAPSDLAEGEEYIRIAVKTATLVKILSVFAEFNADVAILSEGGKYYISTNGKAKTPLEVMSVTEEDKASFIKPSGEGSVAKASVSSEVFASLIRKGATSVDTEKETTNGAENICIKLNGEEISVSSIDGTKVSFASQKCQVQYTEEGKKEVTVGIKYNGLKQLQTLVSGAKKINLTFGVKNLFISTENRECLSIGLAQKVMPGETFLSKLLPEATLGKAVVDKDEILTGLKTVLSLSDTSKGICLTFGNGNVNISNAGTEILVKLVASEGDLNGEYYYSGKFLQMLCNALDSGNIQMAIKGTQQRPMLFLKNEKGAAMSLLMPVNPGKKEETAAKKKKKEKAEETAEDTSVEDAE